MQCGGRVSSFLGVVGFVSAVVVDGDSGGDGDGGGGAIFCTRHRVANCMVWAGICLAGVVVILTYLVLRSIQ